MKSILFTVSVSALLLLLLSQQVSANDGSSSSASGGDIVPPKAELPREEVKEAAEIATIGTLGGVPPVAGAQPRSSRTSSSYSPYYRVSLTNGKAAGSMTTKTDIQLALSRKYGISSFSLTSWSYSGQYTTFRVFGSGLAETNTKAGLARAVTDSTLRSELGFASCTQVDPVAEVSAALGTLVIVLILIGVALILCVVAIIVCCCCCTAKAVADASKPPTQQVVLAGGTPQGHYVPIAQQPMVVTSGSTLASPTVQPALAQMGGPQQHQQEDADANLL